MLVTGQRKIDLDRSGCSDTTNAIITDRLRRLWHRLDTD